MSIYNRVCVLAAFGCMAAAAASGAGYLSSGGLAALRFQPKAVAAGKSTLPPLPAPVAEAKVSTPPAPINSNATTTVTTVESPAPVSQPLVTTNGVTLTPQMLVDVLRPRLEDGNGHDTRVLVPFGFVPPAGQLQPASPAPGGASTATYHSQ